MGFPAWRITNESPATSTSPCPPKSVTSHPSSDGSWNRSTAPVSGAACDQAADTATSPESMNKADWQTNRFMAESVEVHSIVNVTERDVRHRHEPGWLQSVEKLKYGVPAFLKQHFGNRSSSHRIAREQRLNAPLG